ncbi:universal stress protein [Baekduia sp. Peel2402]|uniref:universal stress protein n=1 Tax=Baekduia sp. Peel2402 TaxID=3458296 RepID=UPI00403EB581
MTLVVGYDGSDGARAAYATALDLAGRLGEGVHIVFSFESPRLGGELHDLDDAIRERGEAVVGEALATAAAAGVVVSSDVRMQDPAAGLIAAADEVSASMIVVGSNGERPLKSVLVGSTPTRLLHLSARPVLVVRAQA